MKALILDNNVVDVVSKEFPVSPFMTWMDCSDDCKHGWTLVDGVLTAPPVYVKTYVRNREDDYPDWTAQLAKIYDDGIDKWKTEMVDPVKTKWPKDNSGPVE